MSIQLYQEAVAITEGYLGPAADRFIERQVKFHLDKKPEELEKQDLVKLAEWVKVSLALLTEDKDTVDKCGAQFVALANKVNGNV